MSTAVEDRDLMRPMTAFAEVIPSKDLAGSFVHKAVKAMKGVDNRPAFLSVPRDVQLQNLPYDYTPVNSVESPAHPRHGCGSRDAGSVSPRHSDHDSGR